MAHESEAPEAAHSSSQSDPSLSRNVSFSRLNAQAPEFVPTPRPSAQPPPRLLVPPPPPPPPFHHHVPIQAHVIPVHHPHPHHVPVPVQFQPHPHHSHHHHNHHQYYDQEVPPQAQIESDHAPASSNKNNKLSEEAALKVLNQVLRINSQLPTAFFYYAIRVLLRYVSSSHFFFGTE
jgi:La-related protein 7